MEDYFNGHARPAVVGMADVEKLKTGQFDKIRDAVHWLTSSSLKKYGTVIS
jgi:hypothetical protein